MKFLPWKDDKWVSKEGSIIAYDKLEHFLIALIGTFVLSFLLSISFAIIFVGVLGIVWEIKDGLIPYDGFNIQGFSWKDLIADFGGILGGYFLFIIYEL